jgi:hypothetical protein
VRPSSVMRPASAVASCLLVVVVVRREAAILIRGATAVELRRPRDLERRRGSVDDGSQVLLRPMSRAVRGSVEDEQIRRDDSRTPGQHRPPSGEANYRPSEASTSTSLGG